MTLTIRLHFETKITLLFEFSTPNSLSHHLLMTLTTPRLHFGNKDKPYTLSFPFLVQQQNSLSFILTWLFWLFIKGIIWPCNLMCGAVQFFNKIFNYLIIYYFLMGCQIVLAVPLQAVPKMARPWPSPLPVFNNEFQCLVLFS